MNSNEEQGGKPDSIEEQGGKPDSIELGEEEFEEEEFEEEEFEEEEESFKDFLIETYSVNPDLTFSIETFIDYKQTFFFYLYRIINYLFTSKGIPGLDDGGGNIEVSYKLIHDLILTPTFFEQILKPSIEEGIPLGTTPHEQIAYQRLYYIWRYNGNFDGFEESDEWDYLRQLEMAAMYCDFCNKTYESEMSSNPLNLPEDFPQLQSLCFGTYHSSLELKKIQKIEDSGVELLGNYRQISGEHYLVSPPSCKTWTFNDEDTDSYIIRATISFFLTFEKSKNPKLTRSVKMLPRKDFNKSHFSASTKATDLSDLVEFGDADRSLTPEDLKLIANKRNYAKEMQFMASESNLSYKQVKPSLALTKIYYGSRYGQPPNMWGLLIFPLFNPGFLMYLNQCLPLEKQITTEEEYKKLVTDRIRLMYISSNYLFKLQKKYGEKKLCFIFEIVKRAVYKYGIKKEDTKILKLFYYYFCNITAGDKNKVLTDYILHSSFLHTIISIGCGNRNIFIDNGCNNTDNPDDTPEIFDPYVENSQTQSQTERKYEPKEDDAPPSKMKAVSKDPDSGGTRKMKKGNKKTKKTKKIKKRTKKIKKRTKKTKKLKKLK